MPTIISDGGGATASVALAEDRLGVTRVVAIDNNPTTITYSIVSGADQFLFQINATTGLLAFVDVPNFEAPTDTDHDNAYVVQVQATNGAQTTTQTITVNVTDANDISGTAGADFLVGGPTAQVIDGLAGADQLLGNGGHDTFLINRPTDGVDSLLDFWSGEDVIGLDQIGFGIDGNGSLAVNGVKYVVGSAATTSSPTIIFNPTTSIFSWDADGTGAGAPVAFARFDPGSTVVWAGTIDLGTHGGNYQIVGTGDFDGDGTSDVIWRNPTTGQVDEWHMVNGNWGGSIDLGTHGADYQVAGVGDFNHNGTSDILWRSASTGQVDLWLMVGGNWSSSVNLGSHGTSFQVAGVGDFNGDGTSDVLWRNPTTGQVDLWLMNNGNWSSSVDLGSHGTDFQVAGIGDFNGDGTSDILWRNSSTGQVDEWKMQGGNWAGSVDLGNHGTAWQVGGVTDLNGNGTSDILWRNPTTAEVDGWVMANGNWAGSTLYSTAPDAAWVVSGTGDFNGDGVGDVLWRNPTTGQVNEWHLVRRPIPTANDFNIEGNIVPNVSIPVDTDVAANSVVEGDPSGTHVGLTASSTNPSGDPVTYSLSDSAGGRFAIDPNTGVVTIANAALVNFETAPGAGPSYNITVTATSGALVSSRVFSINVGDVAPGTPSDSEGGTNTVAEGATTGALVGVTVSAPDINGGPLTYTLTDDAGGNFTINGSTGVVSVSAFGAAHIDFESTGPGHTYSITARASDGLLLSTTQSFTITVTNTPPSQPTDSNGTTGGTIQEGAANGTAVGITALSTDPAGTSVTYSLTANPGGFFAIDSTSGVVSVSAAGATGIDFETTPAYTITVRASDGTANSLTQDFTIAVTNANPSTPADANGAADTVTEGVASNQATGLTVQATDPGGTTIFYSLTDDAGGRFQISSSSGVVTTGPNASLIDFELSGGSYNITVQASDLAPGTPGTSSQTFAIAVADAPPSGWTDDNAGADTVVEGAANTTAVGVTAHAVDPNGGIVTYTLTVNPGNAFAIDSSSGVITVADGTAIDFESTAPGHTYTITVKGADASGAFTTHDFILDVTNAAPSTPVDNVAPTGGTVVEGALAGSTVGITALSVDPGGSGAVTYSLTNDAGGLFAIDAGGIVTVTAFGQTHIDYETSGGAHSYGITVDATDGTVHVAQNFTIVVQNAAPSQPVELDGNTANDVVSKSPIANTGDQVGITLSSTDPNNGATITYSLTDDAGVIQDSGGLFSVDAAGVVRVANNAQLSTANVGDTFTIFGRASDGTNFGLAQSFTVTVISNTLTLDLNGPGAGGNAGVNFAATYTEQGTAKAIADTDDFISNTGTPGADTIVSATIVLTDAKAGDSFDLSTLPGGFSPVVTPGAGTITLTLSGAHTFAQYSSALQQIKFTTSGDAPDTSLRHINVTVNDGSTNSNTAQAVITVESVNDTPTLTLGPAGAVSYTENGGPLAFFTTGSVTDPDAPANFNGGSYKVEITGNADTGDQIVLLGASGFTVAAGPSLVFGGNTIGTITGLGTSLVTVNFTTTFATPAVVSQLADAFAFQSTSENPSGLARDVTFTFNDGNNSHTDAGSTAQQSVVHQTVNVTPVNDAPVVTATTLTSVAEDTTNPPGATISSLFTGHFTDVDGGTLAGIAITADPATPAEGQWQYSTDAGANWFAVSTAPVSESVAIKLSAATLLRFLPAADYNGTPPALTAYGLDNTVGGTFTNGLARVNIDASVNGGTTAISDLSTTISTTVTEVNDAPTASADTLVAHSTEDVVRVITAAELLGNDSTGPANESNQHITVTSVSGAVGGTAVVVNGSVVFTPTANFSGTAGFDYTVQDDGTTNGAADPLTSASAHVTFTIDAVNDAPVLNSVASNAAYVRAAPATVLSSLLTVTDVDNANLTSATVRITDGVFGDVLSFSTAGTSITGSYSAANHTLVLTGSDTTANYQAVLRTVGFSSTSSDATDHGRHIEWQVNDGTAPATLFSAVVAQPSVGTQPRSITAGDFNGDGRLDLAVANDGSDNVSVLLGNGAGGFTGPTNFTAGDGPFSVATADLDGDGKLDLVVANNTSDNVSVLLGNGTGGFTGPTNFAAGDGALSVAIGDINRDGRLDLAVSNYNTGKVSVLLGDGSGGFVGPTPFAAGTNPYGIALGDLNGDGFLDIAAANEIPGVSSNDVTVLLNNGSGGFGAATSFAAGTKSISVAMGDFDGDNDLDLAVANQDSDNVSVLLNNGSGTAFTLGSTLTAGGTPFNVRTADIDGDGFLDLAVVRFDGHLSVFHGTGTGSFVTLPELTTGNEPTSVAIGDFDGNGAADLAVTSFFNNNVSVFLNNTTGLSQVRSTAVAISAPIQTGLTSQLWYVTRDGDPVPNPTFSDNVVGYLNSNNTAITPVQDTGATNENDLALYTAGGLYFVATSDVSVESRHTSDGTVADTLDLSSFDTVDSVAVTSFADPINDATGQGTLFVGVTGSTPGTTGILEVAFDGSGNLVSSGNYLVTQTSFAGFFQAIDMSVDLFSRTLYYVDDDLTGGSNAIFAVDYNNGSFPKTTADNPTIVQVSATGNGAGQFELDGTSGFIEAVAVNNLGDLSAANDIVYFLTSDNKLWYIDRNAGTTATQVTGVTLTGVGAHAGLSYDSVSHSLFITDQGSSIIQAHLSATGTVDTTTPVYTTAQLTGHTVTGTPIPAATAIDILPTITVHNGEFTEVNPTSTATLVDPLLTVFDPDLLFASATITLTGGFVGSGDVLDIDTTGTGITIASNTIDLATGIITLVLSGTDTIPDYQTVLRSLTFISGDDPTNGGLNTTRTLTWHISDGANGDPYTDGNTKTSTITIHETNDAPTAVDDAPSSSAEDAVRVFSFASLTGNDNAGEASQTLTITGVSGAVNGSVQIIGNSVVFTPTANFNGTAEFDYTTQDNGTTNGANDFKTDVGHVSFTVDPVNGAPTVTATSLAAVNEDATNPPGDTLSNLFTGHFTDTDAGSSFAGVAVSANTANAGTQGAWQYSTDAGANWFDVGSVSDASALALSASSLLRFLPAANFNGAPPALSAYGLDNTFAGAFTNGATTSLIDASVNGGTTAISDDAVAISTSVTAVNDAPTLDLDSTSVVGISGNDYAASYNIGGAAVAVASTHVDIVDVDDTNMESATVVLTTGDASDTLTINGALPVGISGSVGPLVGGAVGGTITVSLSGSATKAAYDQALSQIQFSTADASASPAPRSIDFVVNDGPADSNHPTSTITIIANPAPIAKDDADSGAEAGGANNGTAGSDAVGNVITGVGTVGGAANADTDPNGSPTPQSGLTVIAVTKGTEAAPGAAGTVGSPLVGQFGTITLNSDGSYTYVVDNTNTTVQGLRTSGQFLTDTFTYTLQDAGNASNTANDSGAQTNSVATLTITITGANDNPTAVADTASATEKGGVPGNGGTGGVDPTGNVLTNDTDVDAPNPSNPALNGETKTVQGVAANVQAGPLTANTGADVTGSFGKINIAADGSYTYTVDNTNASVQALRTTAQTITDTFSYTMHDAANVAGTTSTTQIVVTIHGQNDNPVANNDAANAQEQGGTNNGSGGFNPSGNVLTAVGGSHSTAVADTDVDSAANGETQVVQGVAATDVHSGPALITGVGSAIAGTYGSLTINSNGSFSYTLNNSANNVQALTAADHPTDVFTYTMKDTVGVTANAIVTVTVDGANDAPVAVADGTYVVIENRTTSVTTPTLLANDTDVDAGASLTAVKDTNTAQSGTVTVNANGTFSVTYAPGNNYLGTDTFTYHANDGSLNSASATVTLDVQPLVWFIDSSIAASDATHFKTIAEFNTANAGATHADIVYLMYGNPGGTGVYATTDGINLSSGQVLLGQGVDLTYTKTDTTLVTLLDTDNTKIPTIQVTGGAGNAGVTLSTNNTLKGFTIDSTNADAIGIEDGAGTVGTLTISNGVTIGGVGKAIDIDQGGTLAVSLANVTSTGSNSEGIQLGGIAGSLLGGSFAVTGTTSITNADTTGIQVLNTAASASFNFGTATSVTDSAIATGHNGNGIELVTGIGATNSFTLGNTSITTDGGFGLKAASAGTVTFGTGTNAINATGGAAVDITSTALSNATFSTVSSSGSSTYGINLVNQTSAFTANGGTIGTADTAGVHISGGTAAVSIASAINSSNGIAVDISGHSTGAIGLSGTINHTSGGDRGIVVSGNTGGTISFTGQTTIASTTATGVDLTTNGGTTITFDNGGNGLDITTTTGVGFNATGGATAVNVIDHDGVGGQGNTIASGTGTALNIANTTIGASGLTFQSIAANGAVNGIVLNNTGATGGLTVTGDSGSAVNGSGGIITASTGVGISLTSTKGVSLDQMTISNGGNDGINGSSVTDFSLTNSTVTGNGNAVGEHGMEFANLAGNVLISGTTVHNSFSDGLRITNTSGTINTLNIKNDTFDQSSIPTSPAGGNGILVDLQGTAVLTDGSISNSAFTNNFSNGVLVNTNNTAIIGVNDATSSSTHGFVVSGNTFHNNNISIQFGVFGSSDLTTDIQNNTIVNAGRHATSGPNSTSTAIVVATSSTALAGSTLNARIDGNTIGDAAVAGSGSSTGSGIRFIVQGLTDATVLINNNTIRQAPDAFGIDVESLGSTSGVPPTSDVTITNNNVDHVNAGFNPGTSNFPGPAIYVAGDNQGTAGTLRAIVTGNTVPVVDGTHPATAQFTGAYLELFEYQAPNGILQLVDVAPASASALAELQSHNTGSIATGGGTIDLIAGPITTPPDLTPLPQLSAQGEGPGTAATLTLDALAPIVQEAVHRWETAGITQQQMAALAGLQFGISDIGDGWLGQTINHGRIVVDDNGAGWGWFVDPTPGNDSEFAAVHSSTEAVATSGEAAGGMDLLTVVMHEIGHLLGFEPSSATGNLMDEALDLGVRRLPSAEDVAVIAASATVADTFVVSSRDAPVHIAAYSAAKGDAFDFSALQVADAANVRVVEDASDAFATLQIDIGAGGPIMRGAGAAPASHWVSVAQVDGVHAGDAIDVWLNPAQLAHLHAGLLG
jgi:VCBS repeat-containing protein